MLMTQCDHLVKVMKVVFCLLFAPALAFGITVPKLQPARLKPLTEVKAIVIPKSVEGVRAWEDINFGYRVVLVVDKAAPGASPTAQTLSVFQFNESTQQWSFRSDMNWIVSTGHERNVGKDCCGHTRTGFFRAETLDHDYVSRKGEAMPSSIFYDHRFGVAIHGTRDDWYQHLGTRRSLGCTRLRKVQAEQLYNLVQSAGNGYIVELVPQTGAPAMYDEWGDDQGRIFQSPRKTPRVIGPFWRTMVINTDTSEINPNELQFHLDPREYQQNPNLIFEIFNKHRPTY